MAYMDYCNSLASVWRWSASGRRTGRIGNLRHSLDIRDDLSSGGRCPTTSTGQCPDTFHQGTSHSDDGQGTCCGHDVEADIKLDEDFAGGMESPLAVIACQLCGDEVRETGCHYTHACCNTRPQQQC